MISKRPLSRKLVCSSDRRGLWGYLGCFRGWCGGTGFQTLSDCILHSPWGSLYNLYKTARLSHCILKVVETLRLVYLIDSGRDLFLFRIRDPDQHPTCVCLWLRPCRYVCGIISNRIFIYFDIVFNAPKFSKIQSFPKKSNRKHYLELIQPQLFSQLGASTQKRLTYTCEMKMNVFL